MLGGTVGCCIHKHDTFSLGLDCWLTKVKVIKLYMLIPLETYMPVRKFEKLSLCGGTSIYYQWLMIIAICFFQ